MSREIDERVVQMKFENGTFERNIQTSIHSLDELKKGLDFKDATKGFEQMEKASGKVNMDPLSMAVETLNSRFTLLGITAFNVMNRISNAAINTGEALVRSLSIDQITVGFDKYGSKTSAVQTIMAATAKQFSDTATQMGVVNSQLEKLNWFTDETSYNFVDMVSNIGKFTANNIDLETSVTSMQGIATWAAKSGANANDASRAMYNMSQAMAAGAMKLQDWISIENANMGTAEFKEMAIQAGLAAGTLVEANGKIVTSAKKTEVSVEKFRETLSDGWLSSKVMLDTLDQYGGATNRLNQLYEETGRLTSQLIGDIDDYTDGIRSAEEIAEDWGMSLEDTQKILDEFNTETMQFGLQAFKAAQEAKTFEDAINSVKDAVSTGWMTSFEIIFGDYLQAKELWTDLANALYDIFAAGAEARNDMLREWNDLGGRLTFIDTIWATLASILSILNPIKAAWNDVFGEMTAERLYKITEAIHDFMVHFQLTGKAAQDFRRTFSGLFAVVDMFRIILTGAVKSAIYNFRRIMQELNIDVLDFTGNIGDTLVKLRDWLKNGNLIAKTMNTIGDVIIIAIRAVKQLVAAFQELGPVKAIMEAFRGSVDANLSPIEAILGVVAAAFSSFWNFLRSLPKITSFSDLATAVSNLAHSFSSKLKDMGISFDGFIALFKGGWDVLRSILVQFGSVFNDATLTAGTGLSFLATQINKVDWAGVALVAMGIVMLATIWKVADAMEGFAKALQNVTGVGSAAKGALNAIKDYFVALKAEISSNNILKIAASIGILAVALGLLAKLAREDWPALVGAAAAIGILGAAITAVVWAMGKFGGGDGGGVASKMLSFAASIALLALALNMIKVDADLETRIKVIVGAVTMMGALAVLLSRTAGVLMIGVTSMVAMAIGINTMIGALNKLSKLDPKEIQEAIPVLAAITLVLGAFTRLVNGGVILNRQTEKFQSLTSISSMIGMVIALNAMIAILKKIADMDPEVAMKGILGAIPIFTALGVLLAVINANSKNIGRVGTMMVGLAVAMNLLIPAIKGFANLGPADVLKALPAVIAIGTLFGTLIYVAKNKGKNAGKLALMILSITSAMMILQLVIKTLGRLDTESLVKGVLAVATVILAFAPAIKAAGGNANVNTVKTMTKLIIAIGVLLAGVAVLSLFDPVHLAATTLGLSAVFLAIGEMTKRISAARGIKLEKLALITTMVGLIGVIVTALSHFADPGKILYVTTGMSEVFLGLAVALRIMNNVKLPKTEQAKAISVMVLAVGGIMAVLGVVSQWTKPVELLALTTGMSEVFLALAVMLKMINKVKLPKLEQVTGTALIVGVLGGVMAVLGVVSQATKVPELLALTTGMSEIMLALAVTLRLIEKTKLPKLEQAQGISLIVGILGIVMAGLGLVSQFTKVSELIALTTGMSEIMLALAVTLRLIDKVKLPKLEQAKGVAAIVLAVGAVMAALGVVSQWTKPTEFLVLVGGMSAILLVLTAMFKILDKVETPNLDQAKSMALIVAALGAVMLGLGYISGYTDPVALIALTTGMSEVLIALAVTFKLIDKVETPDLDHATAISLMVAALGVVMLGLGYISNYTNPITLLALTTGMSEVLVALAACFKLLNGTEIPSIKQVAAMAAVAGVMGLVMMALGYISSQVAIGELLSLTTGMAEVLIGLAACFKVLDNVKIPTKTQITNIAKLTGMIAAIVAGLAIVSNFAKPIELLALTTGMSEVMLSLGACFKIMDGVKLPTEKQAKAIRDIVVAIGLIAMALGLISVLAKPVEYLALTTGMSEVMLALAASTKIMNGAEIPDQSAMDGMLRWVQSVGLIIGALAVIQAVINAVGGSTSGILYLTTGISEILLALAVSAKIIGDQESFAMPDAKTIASLTLLMGVLGAVLGGFSNWTDPATVLPLAVAMSAVLVALSACVKILGEDQESIPKNALVTLGITALIAAAMGIVLSILSNVVNPISVLPIAIGMGVAMLALTGVVKIISTIPVGSLAGALQALGILALIVAGLGILAVALGYLYQNPTFKAAIDNSGEAMIALGEGIGGFIGGIIGGFAEGVLVSLMNVLPAFGEALSDFMENVTPFVEGVTKIPEGAIGAVAALLGLILAFTATEFISGLTELPIVGDLLDVIFGKGQDSMKEKLTMLGEMLAEFAEAVGDTDTEKVKNAAEAAKILVELEKAVPRKGGALQAFLGEQDLGEFANRLETFGKAIVGFVDIAGGISAADVEGAVNAGYLLNDLEKALPKTGGKVSSWLFGQHDLAAFGERLNSFGYGLKLFEGWMVNFDPNCAASAYAAGTLLSELENSLPRTGGTVSTWLFGEKSLASFSDRITEFGSGLVAFNDLVDGNLNPTAIASAVAVSRRLAELEGTLTSTGGIGSIFFGESSFKNFGNNLKTLGNGLYDMSQSLSGVNFDTLHTAVTYIRSLVGLDGLSEAAASITSNVKSMMKDIKNIISSNEREMKNAGWNVAKWIIEGLKKGVDDNIKVVEAVSKKLSKKIVDTVEGELEIASPSAVMEEDGHWIVKGIAEGITDETSAEDAIAKKAQNIVSAFENTISSSSLMTETRSLQDQLWELTEGKNATNLEKQERELDREFADLVEKGDQVKLYKAELDALAQAVGTDSQTYIQISNKYMQAQIDMLNKREEFDELLKSVTAAPAMTKKDQYDTYVGIIDDWRETYEYLGKSEEELFAFAREQAGIDAPAPIIDPAKYDSKSIVDAAMNYQTEIEIEEGVTEKVSKSVSKGISKGVSSGIDSGVDSLLTSNGELADSSGGSVLDKVSEAFNNIGQKLFSAQDEAFLEGTIADIGGLFSEGASSAASAFTESFLDTGALDDIWNNVKDFGSNLASALGFDSTSSSNYQAVHQNGVNFDEGLAAGIKSAVATAKSAAMDLGSQALSSLQSILKVASPSKETYEIGRNFALGYLNGIKSKAAQAQEVSADLGSTSASALSQVTDQIQAVLDNEGALSPTITPVLDLSELKNDAQAMKGVLGADASLSINSSKVQASSVASQKATNSQNGSKSGVTETNYNFTQNNYSPKALSRVDIYRQTKNQFSQLKSQTQATTSSTTKAQAASWLNVK